MFAMMAVVCVLWSVGCLTGVALGAVNCDTVPPPPPVQLDSVYTFSFGTFGGTDCWGWTGPDGTEYAIMGTAYGVAFVNTSALEVVDSVEGPVNACYNTYYRDIKTYRHYCYVVSECTGTNPGLMVIDLQYLPDSVHFLGALTSGGVTSHNLSIDTAKGYLYSCESDYSGFRVYTLANPINPVIVANVPTGDIHDMFARNDTVYVSEGSRSSYSVWDMADKANPALIVRVTIPPADGYSHNIWLSDDGNHVVTTEETGDYTIKVWDISDIQNIRLASSFLAIGGLAHNAHVKGNQVITSHYESGVQIEDITVPECPAEVARFDTYDGEHPWFHGCWGAYPFTQNGLIYGSNLDGRLFILTTTDTVVFSNYSASPLMATAPTVVQFTDESKSMAAAWKWDFGDGDTSVQQSPSHVYGGGLFTVQLEITTPGGYHGHRTRNNYITVLGADTLGVNDIIMSPGSGGYWDIYCHNRLPIAELILPVTMTNVTSVAFLDSISFAGLRMGYFELKQLVFDNRFSGQIAYRLRANTGGGSPALPPGDGPIARVYYRTRSNASDGDTVHLSVGPLGTYSYQATTYTTDFVPAFTGGTLTIGDPCSCPGQGDLVDDGFPNSLDMGALIDYLFAGGDQPPIDANCPHEDRGDVNCDGFDDSVDLGYMIDFLFAGGPPPCNPCDCTSYPDACP